MLSHAVCTEGISIKLFLFSKCMFLELVARIIAHSDVKGDNFTIKSTRWDPWAIMLRAVTTPGLGQNLGPATFRSLRAAPRGAPELAEREAKKKSFLEPMGRPQQRRRNRSRHKPIPATASGLAPRAGHHYTTISSWGGKNSTVPTLGAPPAPARHPDLPILPGTKYMLKALSNTSPRSIFMPTNVVNIFQCPWFPKLLPTLHKILNHICKRPRNRTLLHTYLCLTSKASHSPTPKSLAKNLPRSVPGSAFPASAPEASGSLLRFSRNPYQECPGRLQFPESTEAPAAATSWGHLPRPFSHLPYSSRTFSSLQIWVISLKKNFF